MPLLSLSIGSNVNPATNVRKAIDALRAHFGELRLSTVYESKAVGFDGDNFLNLVLATETEESLDSIKHYLKDLEDRLGRDRSKPKFSGRVIDVDILTYGDSDGSAAGLELPRGEITRNAYVLRPLADLLPETVHPPTGKTYGQLWQDYDKSRQALWSVDFDWQD